MRRRDPSHPCNGTQISRLQLQLAKCNCNCNCKQSGSRGVGLAPKEPRLPPAACRLPPALAVALWNEVWISACDNLLRPICLPIHPCCRPPACLAIFSNASCSLHRNGVVEMGNVSSTPDEGATLYLRDQNRCMSSPPLPPLGPTWQPLLAPPPWPKSHQGHRQTPARQLHVRRSS